MKDLENKIRKYLVDRGWDSLRPSDIAKSIVIESSELLELFQWENLSLEEIKKNKQKIKEVQKELADVFIYALDMAVLLNLDTQKIIEDKLKHISKKYPAKLMRKNAKQGSGSGTDSEYWRIKKSYRKEKK